jgi:hypothetical protein
VPGRVTTRVFLRQNCRALHEIFVTSSVERISAHAMRDADAGKLEAVLKLACEVKRLRQPWNPHGSVYVWG